MHRHQQPHAHTYREAKEKAGHGFIIDLTHKGEAGKARGSPRKRVCFPDTQLTRMTRHFPACAICGLPGHKAKDCGLRELEARKDPFGEESRRAEYRRRADTRKSLPPSPLAPQFSRAL